MVLWPVLIIINHRLIFIRECEEERLTSCKVFAFLALKALVLTRAVLNRARPENEEKERKTASGRTFRVQV